MQRRAESSPLRGTRWETCSRTPERSAVRSASSTASSAPASRQPRVGRVDAVPAAADLAHRDELVLVGAALGRVLEAGRVAPGSLLERLVEEVAHPRQLVRSRRPVLEADHRQPDLAVRGEAEHVDRRRRLLEALEVARGRRPGERHVGRVPVDRLRRELLVEEREAAEAAVADDLERDALVHGARRARVDEQREVGVAVDVDEAGRDDLAGRVDLGAPPPAPSPTATMRPSRIPTSAARASAPVPSMTTPLRIARSTLIGPLAARRVASSSTAAVGEHDAVAVAGGRDGDLAVEHVLEHGRGIPLVRVAEAATAGRGVGEPVALLEREGVHRHRRQLARLAAGDDDVARRRPGLAAVEAVGRMVAAVGADRQRRLRREQLVLAHVREPAALASRRRPSRARRRSARSAAAGRPRSARPAGCRGSRAGSRRPRGRRGSSARPSCRRAPRSCRTACGPRHSRRRQSASARPRRPRSPGRARSARARP